MMWQLPPCPYPPLNSFGIPKEGIHLDMGCGERVEPYCYGVDICSPKAHLWCDFTKGLPFKDNSVAYMKVSHILEHLHDKDWFTFMDECWRVLQADEEWNRMYVAVPRCDHWHAIGDPEHVRIIHPNHFLYLTPEWHYYTRCKKWSINDICWCQKEELRVLLRPIKDEKELRERMERRDKISKDHNNFMICSFQPN